jgi:hypothetical protein
VPYYVGKAAKQNFEHECFSIHKRGDHYNMILCSRSGTPYMSFAVQQKTKGKWSATAIDEVEEYIIAQAVVRNPKLTNRRRLPYQSWSIKGVTGTGPGAQSLEAKHFCKLVGISD